MLLARVRFPAALLCSFHPKYIDYLNAINIPSRELIAQVLLHCMGDICEKDVDCCWTSGFGL